MALVNKAGFCHHTLYKNRFTTEFVDGVTGKVLGSYTKLANPRTQDLMTRFQVYKTLPDVRKRVTVLGFASLLMRACLVCDSCRSNTFRFRLSRERAKAKGLDEGQADVAVSLLY